MKLSLNTGGQLILASCSPRRRELLDEMNLDFRVQKSAVDENAIPADHPRTFALRAAFAKASDVASQCEPGDVVLAADTVVTFNNIIFGKPADEGEAREILGSLSGRTHSVMTAFAISAVGKADVHLEVCETRVVFENLTDAQIESYVATGSPLDKAGAYGIQDLDRDFIAEISGDYYNVVGLPCDMIAYRLREYMEFPEQLKPPMTPKMWR